MFLIFYVSYLINVRGMHLTHQLDKIDPTRHLGLDFRGLVDWIECNLNLSLGLGQVWVDSFPTHLTLTRSTIYIILSYYLYFNY